MKNKRIYARLQAKRVKLYQKISDRESQGKGAKALIRELEAVDAAMVNLMIK